MDDNLIQTISESYHLTSVKFKEKFATSNDKFVYQINSQEGEYIVKLTFSKREEMRLKKDVQILSYLEQYHFPAPKLIAAKNGFLYTPFGNRFFYIYHFIEGNHPQPNLHFFNLLGTLMAKLHSIPIKKYPHRSNYTPSEQLPSIYKLLKAITNKQNQKKVDKLLIFIHDFPSFDDLPLTFTHSDPFFLNFLQNQNTLSLLDWDDAGVGYPVVDIGYILAHLCLSSQKINGSQNRNSKAVWKASWAQAFLDTYQKIRPLKQREKEALPYSALFTLLTYIAPWKASNIDPALFGRFMLLERIVLENNLSMPHQLQLG